VLSEGHNQQVPGGDGDLGEGGDGVRDVGGVVRLLLRGLDAGARASRAEESTVVTRSP